MCSAAAGQRRLSDDRCYEVILDKKDYDSSLENCQQRGATLASLGDLAVYAEVIAWLREISVGAVLLGLQRDDRGGVFCSRCIFFCYLVASSQCFNGTMALVHLYLHVGRLVNQTIMKRPSVLL